MTATKRKCAYVECNEVFHGGKRAMYCCDKHGQYQRRLNASNLMDKLSAQEQKK